jgi:hypothetical protein
MVLNRDLLQHALRVGLFEDESEIVENKMGWACDYDVRNRQCIQNFGEETSCKIFKWNTDEEVGG